MLPQLRKLMADIQSNWSTLAPPGTPCPIRYGDEERGIIHAEAQQWQINEDAVTTIETILRTDREGYVHPEDYELVMAAIDDLWEMVHQQDDHYSKALREIWPWNQV